MGLPARNPQLLVIQFRDRIGGRTHPTPRLGRRGAFLQAISLSAQQLRQFGEVRRHPPRLVALQPSRRKVAISG
jgi:hypothetical protein